MPMYRYKAIAGSADAVEGEMEAENRAAVVDRVHALGHIPIRIDAADSSYLANLRLSTILPARRIRMRSLALITTQLATLLHAGLALDDALRILAELVEGKRERESLRRLHEKISGGVSLADAMSSQANVFPEFYISMVRAGEAGASLEAVLDRLGDFLERSQSTREHITSALIYPAVVAGTCCLSIAMLFLFVVPRFRPLFEQGGDTLPASAQYLLDFADFFAAFWWAFIVLPLIAVLVAIRQYRRPTIRQRWDRRMLRVPLLGELISRIEVARFSRTLGTLMKNGVPLLHALSITRETVRNSVFNEAVATIQGRVKTGKGLAEPLQHTRVFPPLAVHLVRVGEETGRQDEMLFKIADIFEADTRRSIDRILALLTPGLTIVLGLIVAGVIGTILTAILSVYDFAM
jgi:general secretion pathway protein F